MKGSAEQRVLNRAPRLPLRVSRVRADIALHVI